MSEKTKYSAEDLKEFEELITLKLNAAKHELALAKEALGGDETKHNSKVLEDGAETQEKQRLIGLIERQAKFISNLGNALLRIKNGTYGVCIDTGVLIPKARLLAVPHTQHSIESKQNRK